MVLPSPFTVGNCTDEFYVFGESCTLGCEKGYAPAGSIEIHCQADQTYSAPDGECDEVCACARARACVRVCMGVSELLQKMFEVSET